MRNRVRQRETVREERMTTADAIEQRLKRPSSKVNQLKLKF